MMEVNEAQEEAEECLSAHCYFYDRRKKSGCAPEYQKEGGAWDGADGQSGRVWNPIGRD